MEMNIRLIEEKIKNEIEFTTLTWEKKDGRPKKAIKIESSNAIIDKIILGYYDDFDFYHSGIIIGDCKFLSFDRNDDKFYLKLIRGYKLIKDRTPSSIPILNLNIKIQDSILEYLKGLIHLMTQYKGSFSPARSYGSQSASFSNLNFNIQASDFYLQLSQIVIKVNEKLKTIEIENVAFLPIYIRLTLAKTVCRMFNQPDERVQYENETIKIFLNSVPISEIGNCENFKLKVLMEFYRHFDKHTYLAFIIRKCDEIDPIWFFIR